MIEYIEKEYGREYVGQIITFQRMAAKGAIRAAGRAWNIPYEVADKIAKMIPPEQGIEIKEVFDIKPEFKQAYDNDEVVRKMINTAMALEGLPSNPSTHAAGVLISPHKLVGNLPMWMNRGAGGETTIVCQYDMNKLEQLGYLKMDFLGLSTLTVIGDTLKFIKINHGITIEYQKLIDGLGDKPETYALMAKGDTQGVFQLEGAGMTTTAIKMQVANFNEATALVALYRPGPMDYIPAYIKNKQNPKDIDVPFD